MRDERRARTPSPSPRHATRFGGRRACGGWCTYQDRPHDPADRLRDRHRRDQRTHAAGLCCGLGRSSGDGPGIAAGGPFCSPAGSGRLARRRRCRAVDAVCSLGLPSTWDLVERCPGLAAGAGGLRGRAALGTLACILHRSRHRRTSLGGARASGRAGGNLRRQCPDPARHPARRPVPRGVRSAARDRGWAALPLLEPHPRWPARSRAHSCRRGCRRSADPGAVSLAAGAQSGGRADGADPVPGACRACRPPARLRSSDPDLDAEARGSTLARSRHSPDDRSASSAIGLGATGGARRRRALLLRCARLRRRSRTTVGLRSMWSSWAIAKWTKLQKRCWEQPERRC